jgi:hypothetical protein
MAGQEGKAKGKNDRGKGKIGKGKRQKAKIIEMSKGLTGAVWKTGPPLKWLEGEHG